MRLFVVVSVVNVVSIAVVVAVLLAELFCDILIFLSAMLCFVVSP